MEGSIGRERRRDFTRRKTGCGELILEEKERGKRGRITRRDERQMKGKEREEETKEGKEKRDESSFRDF